MDATQPGPARTLLQLRVGVFILAALAIFVGLVYFLGRQAGLFEAQYRLVAAFAQIGGLTEGATVRLAGVPVGRVTAVRLPESSSAKVAVELTLVRRVQSRVRADSVARIETLGLLGDKIVEVTLGSPDQPVLADGAALRTEEPLDTAQLVKQGTELIRNMIVISGDLRTVLTQVSGSSVGPDLAEAVRSLRALVSEVEKGQGLLHALIYDRRLPGLAGDAGAAFRQLRETAQRLDRVLADATASGVLEQTGRTVTEARTAIERLNRLARQVEEGKGLLHALIYDESQTVQVLDRLLTRADQLIAGVDRGEGALGVLVRDREAERVLRRVVQAADGLAQAVARAREADGLLRALVFDPGGKAVVADLQETARHFRTVTERVARGEGLLGQLTQPGSEELTRQLGQGLAGMGRLADDLTRDDRLAATLQDLRAAMASLRAITARLEAGEGTLGGLLVDPTVYENLAAFLEGAQRSLLLRALIRHAIGQSSRSQP
jgi:phospholipid/cholesterol/gamma-HCH transport system substrate-binding protein